MDLEDASKQLNLHVASGYSGMKGIGLADRSSNIIIALRSYNNFVKSALINKCPQEAVILDLCSGKGGDLKKWASRKPKYVTFCDIASRSVYECIKRYNDYLENETRHSAILLTSADDELDNSIYQNCFPAEFLLGDCFSAPLYDYFKPSFYQGKANVAPVFDFVSCQFALHYAFDTEKRAHQALKNIGYLLKPGCCFVCTIPDKDIILARLYQNYKKKPEMLKKGASPRLSRPNIYSIDFDPLPEDLDKLPPFGVMYKFWLNTAIDNIPEPLVDKDSLISIAAKYGLEPAVIIPFCDFRSKLASEGTPARHLSSLAQLWRTFRLDKTRIDDAEFEAISIYSAFIFQKKASERPFVPGSIEIPEPTPKTIKDIIPLMTTAEMDAIKEDDELALHDLLETEANNEIGGIYD